MTVIVTGAAGFIGSHVADALLANGHRVIALDCFSDYYNPTYKEANVAANLGNPHYRLERIDLTDQAAVQAVCRSEPIDAVIHLAAQAGVRVSLQQPVFVAEQNIIATYAVFEAARQAGIGKIVLGSSSSVYGNSPDIPLREDAAVDQPISPYAASKRACELIASTYHQLYGMDIAVLRFFTVYGERGRPDMSPYIFTDALLRGQPIPKFGDGSSQRDYTYISDIVRGVIACLDRQLHYAIINLGNHHRISLNDYIALLEDITGVSAIIDQQPPQPGDVAVTYADISRAKQLLDWQPQTSLQTGLTRFVDWYRTERL